MEALQRNLSKLDCEQITRFIYDLSMSKKGSNEFQHLISEHFGYHSSIFWQVDQKGNLSNPINHNISDYFIQDYLTYFHQYDYLHPKSHLHLYPKEIALRLEDVIPLKNYEASDYYKEFMRKHNHYHEMVITFYSRNKFLGVLGTSRPQSEKGFSEADLQRFRILAPIISNLLYLEREYEELRHEKDLLEEFASKNDTGFILLDQNYEVTFMNRVVWDIYRETVGYKSIENFVEDLTSLLLNRFSGLSIPRLQGYKIQVIGQHELFLSGKSRYAILIERDKATSLRENEILNELTMREKEVCFYLKKGCTYKEISEQLFISLHTVNKHAKNIYQKLGVNSRASLQAKLSQWY